MEDNNKKIIKKNDNNKEVELILDTTKKEGGITDKHKLELARDNVSKQLEQSGKSIQESYVKVFGVFSYQQRIIENSFSKPFKDSQLRIANIMKNAFATSIKNYYGTLTKTIVNSMKPVASVYSNTLVQSLKKVLSSYQHDYLQDYQIPIQRIIETIDFSPIYSIFESIKGFDFTNYAARFKKIAMKETFYSKWFPHALCFDDEKMIKGFWDIIFSTRKSKSRIKKIDQLIFESYGKTRIEKMRKQWRNYNLPNYLVRMMNQAVQAYHRREYAITIVMLSTLWEGIIYNKANDARRKTTQHAKENFKKLVNDSDFDIVFYSFYKQYIMYDCYSVEDVIDDVPGRHGVAHCWYSKYPSKKAALNAILFTDFLLKLE